MNSRYALLERQANAHYDDRKHITDRYPSASPLWRLRISRMSFDRLLMNKTVFTIGRKRLCVASWSYLMLWAQVLYFIKWCAFCSIQIFRKLANVRCIGYVSWRFPISQSCAKYIDYRCFAQGRCHHDRTLRESVKEREGRSQ